MIYSLVSSMVVMVVSVTTVTNAYWVPNEAYIYKRQEPTKTSNNPEASKTTTSKKESSTKKEPVSSTKKSASESKTTSKATAHVSSTSSNSILIPTFIGSTPGNIKLPTSTAISSPSGTPLPEAGSSSTGAIVGGVIAGIVAIGGIAAFVILRKRKKARQMSRSNVKPDPFTMGFGSDNYNNNFPPQQTYGKQNTNSFDNYEVTPISTSNKQAIQQQQQQSYQPQQPPMTSTPIAANIASLGSFVVIATYIPTLSDELEIETGDRIELVVEYDDGWCQGINLSKGHTKGVFPRHCIDYATAPSHNISDTDVERSKRVSSMYKP